MVKLRQEEDENIYTKANTNTENIYLLLFLIRCPEWTAFPILVVFEYQVAGHI